LSSIARWSARTLVAAMSVALLPSLGVGPADADQLRYRDATRDVHKFDLADERFTADPKAVNGDIKDVFVHYRKGRLVIRANYVELARRRDTTLSFLGEIKTRHRRWVYSVETSPGRYAGHDGLFIARNGRRACEIGHMFDYKANFTRVVVPLKCLGDPRWVKVSVGAATLQLDEAGLVEFFENAEGEDLGDIPPGLVVVRADDSARPGIADRLRFTPRVYR